VNRPDWFVSPVQAAARGDFSQANTAAIPTSAAIPGSRSPFLTWSVWC
jgi:hypothetical protein